MTPGTGSGGVRTRPSANAALLHARGLCCRIGDRELWHGIDLAVHAGERWAIAGASGTGKTLLLRMLAALTPLQEGAIWFAGKPLAAWWPPAYRAHVVYVMQRAVLPEGTVEAALAAPFRLRVHRGRRYSSATANDYLDAVGIGRAFLAQDTARLSGGEAQVVNVLRALLIEPDVLLLDEPTASLDPARTACVETLVGNWLTATSARACVWTSHDAAQRARVSDHVLALGVAP